jgi:phosphoesterase RecJ-like protein
MRLQHAFEEFRAIIEKSSRFVLTTHVNPDGDGLGSELALAAHLTALGKTVHILNHSGTPYFYRFLDPHHRILRFDTSKHTSVVNSADVIVVLDTNTPDRLGDLKASVADSTARKVCIDHHLDKAEFADLYILDEPSAATGEIVYRLLEFLAGDTFSSDIATALYTAIMTDTGSFRFPKTDATLHRHVARLIECGADPVYVYQQVYEQGSPGRLQLLGRVLSTLQTAHGGAVAYLKATREMFRETGTSEVDTDNMINYTLTIRGVRIGLMVTELEGGVKVSYRSKGDIWISELAKEFGGNGHKNAAGSRVSGATVDDVIQRVIERSKEYLS